MKAKRLLMLTMSILAVATLGSCRRGGRGGSSATSGGQDTSSTTSGHIIPSTTGGTTSGSSSQHTATSIMEDICTWAWGGVESGDLNAPDSEGVVTANYTIGFDVENPGDNATCLNGVLTDMVSDEDFPSYLEVIQGPEYTANALEEGVGASDIFLISDDEAFVLFMYSYYYDSSVSVVFECGPASVYLQD